MPFFRQTINFICKSILNLIDITLKFLLLTFGLFFLLIEFSINIDSKWKQINLFNFQKNSYASVKMLWESQLIFEVIFYSIFALYGHISNNKYSFLFIIPWIIHSIRYYIANLINFYSLASFTYLTINFKEIIPLMFIVHICQGLIIHKVLMYCIKRCQVFNNLNTQERLDFIRKKIITESKLIKMNYQEKL